MHGDTFIINICIFKATQGENFGTLKNINMDVVLQCLQAPEVCLASSLRAELPSGLVNSFNYNSLL